jgi:hypothetical protein
MEEESSSLL